MIYFNGFIDVISFLNDGITLTKNAFVVAQFIAPLILNIRCALKCPKYSVMVAYLSELVLFQNIDGVSPKHALTNLSKINSRRKTNEARNFIFNRIDFIA